MRIITALFLSMLLSFSVQAEEAEKISAATQEKITTALGKVLNPSSMSKLEISVSPIPNLYEVLISGHIFYITADGQFLLSGTDILDLNAEAKNITEERRNGLRLARLNKISKDEMVVFKAEGENKHEITVFTDVDCFYCAKLHKEVGELNASGVTVNYLAFPRSGTRSKTYNEMVSVWCADDQQAAMTAAKAGEQIPQKTCSNPVAQQYDLGRNMGVSGTPALIMPNGELIPGYKPAKELISELNNLDR